MRAIHAFSAAILGLCLTTGCSEGLYGEEGDFNNEGGGRDSTDAGSTDGDTGGGSVVPDGEQQLLTDPTASLHFVFIANTTRGTLARVAIAGDAILIDTVRVGARPTQVVTVQGSDVAVVLNTGSDTVSVVRAGAIGDEIRVTSHDVVREANALVVAPDGRFAFAWYDNERAVPGDVPGSLSEVTAVDLTDGSERAFQMSVGLNIRDIVFDDAGTTAFVLSDEGVSPVNLDRLNGDGFYAPIDIDGDPLDGGVGGDREVLITGDGRLAIVRDARQLGLNLVSLSDASILRVELPSPPSDVDLIPGTDDVLVTLREAGLVERIDTQALLAGALDATTTYGEFPHPVGQTVLSADGRLALVFSGANSTDEAPLMSILALDRDVVDTLNVRKTVSLALISPDQTHALLVHTKAPGDPVAGAPEADIIAQSYAYTAMDLVSGLVKLVRVDALPGEVAFTDDGRHAFVLLADASRAVRQVSWIDLQTFQTRALAFDRMPEHVGSVPGAGYVYVSQIHELGRIAFIDVATGDVREITGFELNGLIE